MSQPFCVIRSRPNCWVQYHETCFLGAPRLIKDRSEKDPNLPVGNSFTNAGVSTF